MREAPRRPAQLGRSTRALVIHVPRSSDPLDVAMLGQLAAALHPVEVCLATTEQDRVRRLTGLLTTSADRRSIVDAARHAEAIVVLNAHLGTTAPRGALRLRDLFALAVATRAAGRRLALLGTTASAYDTPSQCRAARSIALASDYTVVTSRESADRLVRLGVPSPVRVAPDPAWLGVRRPAGAAAVERDLTLVVDAFDPGVGAVLDLSGVVEAVVDRLPTGRGSRIRILTWNGGRALDPDLHAASQLGEMLRSRGLDARVGASTPLLEDLLPVVAGSGLVLATHPHAVVSAVAAGAPTVHLRTSHRRADILDGLGMPTLEIGRTSSADAIDTAVADAARAAASAGPVVDAARREATASLDLLRLLLTNGDHGVPAGPTSPLRPIGVLR